MCIIINFIFPRCGNQKQWWLGDTKWLQISLKCVEESSRVQILPPFCMRHSWEQKRESSPGIKRQESRSGHLRASQDELGIMHPSTLPKGHEPITSDNRKPVRSVLNAKAFRDLYDWRSRGRWAGIGSSVEGIVPAKIDGCVTMYSVAWVLPL